MANPSVPTCWLVIMRSMCMSWAKWISRQLTCKVLLAILLSGFSCSLPGRLNSNRCVALLAAATRLGRGFGRSCRLRGYARDLSEQPLQPGQNAGLPCCLLAANCLGLGSRGLCSHGFRGQATKLAA